MIAIVVIDNKVSIPGIAREIEKGITITKQYISSLKVKGRIKRVCHDKGGFWGINSNP